MKVAVQDTNSDPFGKEEGNLPAPEAKQPIRIAAFNDRCWRLQSLRHRIASDSGQPGAATPEVRSVAVAADKFAVADSTLPDQNNPYPISSQASSTHRPNLRSRPRQRTGPCVSIWQFAACCTGTRSVAGTLTLFSPGSCAPPPTRKRTPSLSARCRVSAW